VEYSNTQILNLPVKSIKELLQSWRGEGGERRKKGQKK